MPLAEAVAKAHFPDNLEELSAARRRLAFDELFMVQLAALKRRAEWQCRWQLPVRSRLDAGCPGDVPLLPTLPLHRGPATGGGRDPVRTWPAPGR